VNFGVQLTIGATLDVNNNNYIPIFMVCSVTYLVALALIHLIAPTLEPVKLGEAA
jgi:hypothetical protein